MPWDGTERRFIIILRPEMMKTISNTRPQYAPEGMAVYAVTEDGEKLVLVRQYRYPVNDYLYELPAGLIRAGGDRFGGRLSGNDRGDRLETGSLRRRRTGFPKRIFPGTGADRRERQHDLRNRDRECGTADGKIPRIFR